MTDWKPYPENVPGEDILYWVSAARGDGEIFVALAYFIQPNWFFDNDEGRWLLGDVVAFAEIPKIVSPAPYIPPTSAGIGSEQVEG